MGNNQKVLLLITGVVLMAIFFYKKKRADVGALAPDFEAELIDQSDFQLSDLRGSYVLLDFWGSWCPPCRKDNPNLVSLHNAFHNKKYKDAENFHVVTIALERDLKRWKRAAEKDGFVWPHQIVQESRFVLSNPLAMKYQVSEIPAKFLINPEGQIIGTNQSKAEIQSYLQSKLI